MKWIKFKDMKLGREEDAKELEKNMPIERKKEVKYEIG
jgi:hypothetical protein